MRATSMIPIADRPAAGAERQLLAAVERVVRHPHGRVALVLHLSALYPNAARPHHSRIARAMLHDVAQRQDGTTYALRNGDVVLLCQLAAPRGGSAAALAALPGTLARLFRRDAADIDLLVSVWPLPQESERLKQYAATRLANYAATVPMEDPPAPAPDMVNTLDALIARARPTDLIQRQTAVLLTAQAGGKNARSKPGTPGVAAQLRPLFQELSFSIEVIEAHLDAQGQISRDAVLSQHFAGRLDTRMLAALREEAGGLGPLDPAGGGTSLPLHLNLTIAGVLSDAFAALAATCRAGSRALAAEVRLLEAGTNPGAFARARLRAGELGVTLVLDGVSHLALVLARPWLLRPDLIKLDWSPRLLMMAAEEQAALVEAIQSIGPSRLVLHRAETEAAIRWGVSNGIRRFQGRHTDAMLAATRIVACPVSGNCNLRQCAERATATGGAGRASCGNLALLDAGAPPMPVGAA